MCALTNSMCTHTRVHLNTGRDTGHVQLSYIRNLIKNVVSPRVGVQRHLWVLVPIMFWMRDCGCGIKGSWSGSVRLRPSTCCGCPSAISGWGGCGGHETCLADREPNWSRAPAAVHLYLCWGHTSYGLLPPSQPLSESRVLALIVSRRQGLLW